MTKRKFRAKNKAKNNTQPSANFIPINIMTGRRLDTFTQFPKLANELQYAVWEHAVEVLPRRIIEVKLKHQSGNFKSMSNTLAPSLLHVCGNSRKFALKKYVPLALDGKFTGTHIYWEKDTVVFEGDLGIIAGTNYYPVEGPKYSQLFDFCTSFVINCTHIFHRSASVCEFLGRFKNLGKVYVLYSEPDEGDGNMFFNFLDQDDDNKTLFKEYLEDERSSISVETVEVDILRGGEKRLKGLRKQEKWDKYLEGRKAAAVLGGVREVEGHSANTGNITVEEGTSI